MVDVPASLDAPSLRALASMFDALSAEATARAEQLDAWDRNRQNACSRLSRLARLPQLVAAEIAAGLTWDQAAAHVAELHQVPPETIAHHWRAWSRSRQAEAVELRRVAVRRLALAGRSNPEIAAELRLSLRTVQRALCLFPITYKPAVFVCRKQTGPREPQDAQSEGARPVTPAPLENRASGRR